MKSKFVSYLEKKSISYIKDSISYIKDIEMAILYPSTPTCMDVCIHLCIYLHACTCTYVHAWIHIRTYVWTYVHAWIHTWTYVHAWTYVHVCMSMDVHIYDYHLDECMYIYPCTHPQIHVCTNRGLPFSQYF